MRYANETSFPFKVLIADGGKDPVVAQKLSDHGNFPRIDYEYIRYPYDQTYREYFEKIADLVSRVKTPYLAFVDDDDFILPGGLRSCLGFLIDHPDYVSCGGRVSKFFIRPDANATYGEDVEFVLLPLANSMDDPTAHERVERHFKSYNVTWYDVQRTEFMRTIYSELSTFNPNDLLFAERFATYLTVARGKVKRIPNLMLLRQFNILGSSCADEKKAKGDYFDRMLAKTWSQEFNVFVDAVTKAIVQEDGLSRELIRDKVIKGYRRQIAPAIVNFLAGEVGVSRETSFSKMRKMTLALKDNNLAKKLIRKAYHKLQDMFGRDIPRARPITQSSEYYGEILPVSNFLTSAGEELKK
jgi:glycosyltransferase domain-containing protein